MQFWTFLGGDHHSGISLDRDTTMADVSCRMWQWIVKLILYDNFVFFFERWYFRIVGVIELVLAQVLDHGDTIAVIPLWVVVVVVLGDILHGITHTVR